MLTGGLGIDNHQPVNHENINKYKHHIKKQKKCWQLMKSSYNIFYEFQG